MSEVFVTPFVQKVEVKDGKLIVWQGTLQITGKAEVLEVVPKRYDLPEIKPLELH